MHDELVKLMGGEVSELQFSKSGPTVILLAGLQGVGKTTVCAKLAFYLKKQVCVLFFENSMEILMRLCYSLSNYTDILYDNRLLFTGKILHAYCWRCVPTCCHRSTSHFR